MNFGIMHMDNLAISKTQSIKPMNTSQAVNSSKNSSTKHESFGDVFQKIVSSTKETNAIKKEDEGAVDAEKVIDLLDADSVEEVLDLLGIPKDEGLYPIETSIEDLLSILNIDPEEFLEIIGSLLGDENKEINDIFELIGLVNDEAPNLVAQLSLALEGNHKVTPKQAEQLLQFLKFAQVSLEKKDLFYNQSTQLTQLKDIFQTVVKEIQKTTGNAEGFKQVVQVVKQTETSDSSQNPGATNQQPTVTKTITITLPQEKPAQGEALVKEIQSLLNRSLMSNTQGTMKLLLKLNPENLGSIRIELIQKDGVLSARLLASTSIGKELLDSQLHQLKSAFVQQNIQLDRIDIVQALQETDLRDQNLFGNLFKQQADDQEDDEKENQNDEEKISFNDYLVNEEM